MATSLDRPLGELQYLQGAGVFDQPGNVLGHQVFRADQNINGEAPQAVQILFLISLVEQFWFCQVGVGPDPADGGGGFVQQLGDLAGHHVGFIAVGDRNHHVGVFGAGIFQDGGVRGPAVHGADIQPVLQFPQAHAVVVHHGDVVGFVGQVFSEGAAHLAGAENQDFHASGFSSTA